MSEGMYLFTVRVCGVKLISIVEFAIYQLFWQ